MSSSSALRRAREEQTIKFYWLFTTLIVRMLDCPLKAGFMIWEVGRALGGGAGAKKG